MKEIKGDFELALNNLITRLNLPEFSKEHILNKWDLERGNDWFTSTLKQDNKTIELKGVELYRVMAERGDKYVKCFVSNENGAAAEFHRNAQCVEWEVIKEDGSRSFYCGFDSEGFGVYWKYVVPINSKGEVLTQEEAGL